MYRCGDYILNPRTNRMIRISGRTAQKIIGKDICQLYPREGREFNPQPHQRHARHLFEKLLDHHGKHPDLPHIGWRGLLLYHGLGSGKTCSYAMMIDEYLRRFPNSQVHFFTRASLRADFLRQYCGFCGTHTSNLLERLSFRILNCPDVKERLPQTLDNSLIIIDEVHNLLLGKLHDSEQLSAAYDRIFASSNSYIVCGSGTPLVDNYFLLYYLIRLLLPNAYPCLSDFEKSFLEKDNVIYPKNEEQLRILLRPAISYYSPPPKILSEFPSVEIVYLDVVLPSNFLSDYISIRQYESSIRPPNPDLREIDPEEYKEKLTRFYLATSMVKSRQFSNYIYPTIEYENEKGDVFVGTAKELKIPDILFEDGGWITTQIFETLDTYGVKLIPLIRDIVENSYKHVVYSEFKSYHGTYLIGALLSMYNIPVRYFDGDMTDIQRLDTLNEFNAENNIYGQRVRVLLLTEAGGEGINLLEVRKIHILEQYISSHVLKQVIGRAVRYQSHIRLPPEERNVTIVNYMLKLPLLSGEDITLEYSSDYLAKQRANRKDTAISFLVKFLQSLDKSNTSSN